MGSSKFSILAYETFDEHKNFLSEALNDTSQVSFMTDPKSFARAVENNKYDVIFMRVSQHSASAFDMLKKTRQLVPYTPIILTSKSEQTDLIVKAIKLGAYDFISTPFSQARVQLVVQRAIEQRKLSNEIDYLRRSQNIEYNFNGIVAESESFKQTINSLKKFASTDSTILLTGKTGTGKSFLSGSIHYNSPRHDHPFIKINCTNIPDTLLESELFGHEKGSFTGAEKQRIGRFEQADGGTIFLDEIGEIPLEIQAKLLRVLEERAFERVGGNKTIHVDVRIIAATNKNLAKQIKLGKFREDLYYRINVLPVELPSLQDRQQCIEPLAKKLLDKSCATLTKKIQGFSANALAIIKSYSWPGNIRQLANTLERAVILEESSNIRSSSIQIPDFHQPAPQPRKSCEPLETQEKELILRALEENLWVQKNAAKQLGVSPRALNYKVNKFGITHPNWRKNK